MACGRIPQSLEPEGSPTTYLLWKPSRRTLLLLNVLPTSVIGLIFGLQERGGNQARLNADLHLIALPFSNSIGSTRMRAVSSECS